MAMELTDSEEPQSAYYCFPSNNASCHKEIRSTAAYAALYTAMAVAVGLTVCGNLLVIISISHFKQLHTPSNLILLSLAVADFLVGVTVLPVTATTLIETCWYFGDLFCSVYMLIDCVLVSISLSNLVVIAMDRYFAVCDPLLYFSKITVDFIQGFIVLSWFLAFSYMLAFNYINRISFSTGTLNSCLGECLIVFSESWGIIDIIISLVFPCCTITTLYIKIFIVAKKHARLINLFTKEHRENKYNMSKASERKAAKTLGIVIFAFLLCWLPYYIWTLIEGNMSMTTFNFFPVVIVYLNSCINPIIYALFYPWFQKSLRLILTFKLCYRESSFINLF